MKLNTKDHPIDVGEFVGAFTSIASQFDRYVRTEKPDADPDATLFIKDVRDGCIEADLIPWLAGYAVTVGSVITFAAGANTLAEFVERYGSLLTFYKKKGAQHPKATASILGEIIDQMSAIANSPDSSLELAVLDFEDGDQKVRAALKFGTKDAKKIRDHAVDHRRVIESTTNATHPRVLMTFLQTNTKPSKVGSRRSGDRVVINKISPGKDLGLVYASPMAEHEIKQEIRAAADNVYLKGFEVDVNVEMRNGKPIAYRVTHLHDVVDLPTD